MSRCFFCAVAIGAAQLLAALAASAEERFVERLLRAYPDHLERIDGNALVWRDGARMNLDDGAGRKSFEAWLASPDIEDMFRSPYPAGDAAFPPEKDADPGRARNAEFFARMYGDCRKGEVAQKLADVAWLPARSRQIVKMTTVNGVSDKLAAVSRELDELPARFDAYLIPSAGTYNCRAIDGTSRPSAHGYGIAIDIAVRHAHYWRWAKRGADGAIAQRISVPMEIVRIFEKNGFIWGGRWYHFDTMHFEYRPELLPEAK